MVAKTGSKAGSSSGFPAMLVKIDRKSTRLNSSHLGISYAGFCLKKKNVNGDGFSDLVSHYRTQETGIAFGEVAACVTGEAVGGKSFEGCDGLNTGQACGLGFKQT